MAFLDKTIDLKSFNPSLINYINEVVRNNIFGTTTIILDNTKGLTSEMLNMIINSNRVKFRIKSAYDDTKIEYNKGKTFLMDGKLVDTEHAYINPVIYGRNELYTILLKIEQLEQRIKEEYSDLEKTVLIYELLRKHFNLEYNTDEKAVEKRTLRGFVSKTLDCSGFSLLLKELLERQNIRCDYVEGLLVDGDFKMPHAWNIIYVDGKFISADLASDVLEYNCSHINTPSYLGEINSFAQTHIPNDKENIQYYQNALTPISNQKLLEVIKKLNIRERSSILTITRNNNTRLFISIVDEEKINDLSLKKIVYYEEINGELQNPSILYTDSNIDIKNNKLMIDGKEIDLTNGELTEKLLGKINITTSLATSNGYIGKISNNNGLIYSFTPNIKEKIKYFQKSFIRDNKSTFVLEQRGVPEELGLSSYEYYCYELIRYIDGFYIKQNIIFTEKDLFSDTKKEIANEFLSRKHIDSASLNNSGYLGYYNPTEIKIIEKSIQKSI